MGTMTLLPQSRPFTRTDLDAMPDDGHRYELIDGMLVVTPAPSIQHQRVVGSLYRLLFAACPDQLEVIFAPFEVALAKDTVVQPDLLVAPRASFTDRDLPTAPLLAVEILSPSTRRYDLTLKRDRFEASGAASYWVIDPITLTLIAWDLAEGRYVERANLKGDESYDATSPFAVTVTPAQLGR
ncbi:Uma2 family endonuclease [Luteipulveratus mongoliensis]|uniref:Putative restriction endonuclease domain-containing protein n=1 Tax=Luteipulveratus mongoliensis TaxID=571913 RepID=A0A0K1JH93_9MICO|nr:Uma2 family endonuclease [Luteipulveratus mongoliensis]AKU16071.1 hypothetical protein VV02_09715 [Luteipulveratus mongoliensis]